MNIYVMAAKIWYLKNVWFLLGHPVDVYCAHALTYHFLKWHEIKSNFDFATQPLRQMLLILILNALKEMLASSSSVHAELLILRYVRNVAREE